MSPGSNPQNSSLAIHMVKIEPEVEPDEKPDLTITDGWDVTVSPGLNLHKSSPAPTIVPKVEPQDITDTSTDDESVAASSHHSSSPAPPLVVIETKEELSLLPGYGGVVFPEPSAAPLSDPSRSTRQQASVTTPQLSPNPDFMLVSRGEGRYEKLIHCEICGKVCRTSNMARHRKRYCLLSPKREELPGKNSPSVIKSEKNSSRSSKGEAYGRSLYGDES
ncbi:uncharacterized protein LOC127867103 [Dreissena polymorpha]|uniref:Uncharacterized protein n=1 Tax=Dreissena polymorpha TaxID=45954 RepID=A0A9D4REL2_DREPO|nr:uncharacterized protein LOC127867103 [Dreissena polymorpha]KAH3865666.1 hypothetical protein DPMN_028708 [Dreissena polymorpha]